MGYPTIVDFDLKFIERTKANVKSASSPNTFTHLINSMIGLIFVPHEFNQKGKRKYKVDFLNNSIASYPELKNIFDGIANIMGEDGKVFQQNKFHYQTNGVAKTIIDSTVGDLLRLCRNGIAHQNITPVADGDRWVGIIIKNYNNKNICNFETYMTQRNLRLFGLFIADQYLKNVK